MSSKVMDMNDPQVILQSSTKPTDKYEYKRVTVSDKQLIKIKIKQMEDEATLLGPGKRPLKWFMGEKISEKLGINLRQNNPVKPKIVQHYEMQTDIQDNLTLKFTGKAGRASAQAQMKELVKKFDEAQYRIKKLKIYRDAAGLSSQSTSKRHLHHHKQYHMGSFHQSDMN